MTRNDVDLLMDLYPKIFFACHSRHVHDPDKKLKLTTHQANVLEHLDKKASFSLQELAVHMGVTPSTMSITVERLVKLGYVKRIRDKMDSRRLNLTLSKQGMAIKRGRSVLDKEKVESILKRLNDQERSVALKGLALLASASEMEMKNQSYNKAWAQVRSSGSREPK